MNNVGCFLLSKCCENVKMYFLKIIDGIFNYLDSIESQLKLNILFQNEKEKEKIYLYIDNQGLRVKIK